MGIYLYIVLWFIIRKLIWRHLTINQIFSFIHILGWKFHRKISTVLLLYLEKITYYSSSLTIWLLFWSIRVLQICNYTHNLYLPHIHCTPSCFFFLEFWRKNMKFFSGTSLHCQSSILIVRLIGGASGIGSCC